MKISKVRAVKTPTRGTAKSAGLDFYVPNDFKAAKLYPHTAIKIPSGICAQIPEDTALVAFNKSSVANTHSLQVGACVVDEDYQGEIHLHVFNLSAFDVWIKPGMKLVQLVCVPVLYIDVQVVTYDQLYGARSERGDGGFGSTDKNPFEGLETNDKGFIVPKSEKIMCPICSSFDIDTMPNGHFKCIHCKTTSDPNEPKKCRNCFSTEDVTANGYCLECTNYIGKQYPVSEKVKKPGCRVCGVATFGNYCRVHEPQRKE